MYGQFNNVKLAGVASMVPTSIMNNIDLANKMDEKSVKKQIRATGIKQRHFVKGNQNAVDLCVGAADNLLKKLDWNRNDIKVLIYVSSYTLFSIPSTAFYIQKALGIGMNCAVFDVNLACSGFVAGIGIIGSLLQNCKQGDKALLCVGVTPSKSIDESDQGTVSLFGDGGGVAAFEVCEGYHTYFSQYSDGNRYDSLIKKDINSPLTMDGMGVFNFTISEVADSINSFFEHFSLNQKELSYIFLHQAQKFILDKLIDFCNLDEEKCKTSYSEFGNTGAVSIPLTMCKHWDLINKKASQVLFMSGFGAGLSWANAWMEIEDVLVLPIIYSDEKYTDYV